MTSSATPINRLTASEQVIARIRRQIWIGELRSGDRLNQEELADTLGVSRIPVREALIGLAHEGAVRMTPHRGAFVEAIDAESVRDHYDLFGHVDGFALRNAVTRSSPDERADLAAEMGQTAHIDDPDVMQRVVIATRARVHELGGSARFRAMARGLSGLVPGNFFTEVPGAVAITQRHLPRVGSAVGAADDTTAVREYETMLQAHGDRVVAILAQRGVV